MGGLQKYMPITYWTLLIGALALRRHPAVRRLLLEGRDHRGGAPVDARRARRFAYLCVLVVRVRHRDLHASAWCSWRSTARSASDARRITRRTKSPAVVTVPLVLLAIPSVGAGWLIGQVRVRRLLRRLDQSCRSTRVEEMARNSTASCAASLHGFTALPFWLALAGHRDGLVPVHRAARDLPKKIAMALRPALRAGRAQVRLRRALRVAVRRRRARGRHRPVEGRRPARVIDGVMVNGSARLVGWFSGVMRLLQTGFIYQYAFAMIFGVLRAADLVLVARYQAD